MEQVWRQGVGGVGEPNAQDEGHEQVEYVLRAHDRQGLAVCVDA